MNILSLPDGTYVRGAKSTDIADAALTTGYVVATGPIGDLAQVAPGGMFGVWTDTNGGTVYVDKVEVWQSRAAATIQAERRGELAIWDVAAGEEILTSHGRKARELAA